MAHPRSRLVVLIAVVLAICFLAPSTATRASAITPATSIPATPLLVLRVVADTPAETSRLLAGGWDVLEARDGHALFVMGDASAQAQLIEQGFRVSVEQVIPLPPDNQRPHSFFNGYRSVAEHAQHLDDVVAAHPNLARVITYGQSWRKTQRLSGFDLRAICITRLRPGDCALTPDTDKPRFLLMAAIHARELATAELAWRWIDLLVEGYGVDPNLTLLLDTSEMWVVPMVNPDGRVIVEQGGSAPYYQRKNANTTLGDCPGLPTSPFSYHQGVDLNRNANFRWSTAGVSANPCEQTFPGTRAASEPEEMGLEALLGQLFRDQRGLGDTDAAPITATGTFVSLHSYANQVLLPWGDTTTPAPNDAGLRALAFRMSHFNHYVTGTGPETLYATSGTTDDFAYGRFGIASFTFELGPVGSGCGGFAPAYTCVDAAFWPANRDALIYAAKSARQPYASALGPSTLTPTLSSPSVWAGQHLTVSAIIDDNTFGNASGSVGRPAAQVISATELYLDVPPWAGGTPIPMQPQDGVLDTSREIAFVPLDTAQLTLGRHILYVRGQDVAGDWGPVTAQWLWVSQPYFMPIIARG